MKRSKRKEIIPLANNFYKETIRDSKEFKGLCKWFVEEMRASKNGTITFDSERIGLAGSNIRFEFLELLTEKGYRYWHLPEGKIKISL